MLATLTDAPFDDKGWIFEDLRWLPHGRPDRRRKVTLYSRNGKFISQSYIEVARALEGAKGDAVIDGELVAIGKATYRISSSCRTRFAMKQNCDISPST